MPNALAGYAPHAYALMRIVVGLLFLCHGLQKVFGLFGGLNGNGAAAPLLSLLGIAGLIELVAGALIAAVYSRHAPPLSPAVRWLSPISSVTCRCGFGRSKTTAPKRCFFASCFFT